jgi:hypothetical protein
MYKEIKVFDAMYDDVFYDNWIPACACRGKACDKLREWSYRKEKRVVESRLLYDGPAPQSGERIYRWVSDTNTGTKTTAWYLSDSEAREAAGQLRLTDGHLQFGELDMEQIDPLRTGQKFSVQFELDGKGRLFTRINAHPERDGLRGKGKVFFPDRSFVGADCGDAVVSIVKEFDTYGFLSGEMVKFGMPDMDRFLDWAWENAKRINFHEVLFINHPGRGEYLAIDDGTGVRRIIEGKDYDGSLYIQAEYVYDQVVKADAERYLVQRKQLAEMFLESAWGMEVDMDVLSAMFTGSRLFESGRATADWTESVEYRGKLLDSAVQEGILSQYVSPSLHIEVVTLNQENIVSLGNYSYNEVKELAKAMGEINQVADEAGLAKVKKGLLLPF